MHLYEIESDSYWRQLKGLLLGESQNREPPVAQLVMRFHARRYGALQASIDLPLPELRSRAPAPPQNCILEALRVKEFMAAHPDETCLSAAAKLNLPRKRISKLLTIANQLPANLITELANCNDHKTLRQLTVKRLFQIASGPSPDRIAKELNFSTSCQS